VGFVRALGVIIALASPIFHPGGAEASLEPLILTFEASPTIPLTNLVLVFPLAINLSSAKIEIVNGQRKRVPIERLQPGSADTEVNVLLKHALPAGLYTVKWRAISAEGKPVKGSYKFNVDP
jgi:methionine-rich copper-binding protein CopC